MNKILKISFNNITIEDFLYLRKAGKKVNKCITCKSVDYLTELTLVNCYNKNDFPYYLCCSCKEDKATIKLINDCLKNDLLLIFDKYKNKVYFFDNCNFVCKYYYLCKTEEGVKFKLVLEHNINKLKIKMTIDELNNEDKKIQIIILEKLNDQLKIEILEKQNNKLKVEKIEKENNLLKLEILEKENKKLKLEILEKENKKLKLEILEKENYYLKFEILEKENKKLKDKFFKKYY
jgi:hypothetical protein